MILDQFKLAQICVQIQETAGTIIFHAPSWVAVLFHLPLFMGPPSDVTSARQICVFQALMMELEYLFKF